jgi:hypothetical protein
MTDSDTKAKYEQGIRNFALLFTRWMDLNGWSHPVMVALAKGSLIGVSWLHSSQISGLRHGKLLSPGPRTFKAIQQLNYYLWLYKTTKKLIPGTSSSNDYGNPYVITEDDKAPDLGWWMEVFVGDRVPKDLDLAQHSFTPSKAELISQNYAKLMRRQMVMCDYDPISDFDVVVREHYPAKDTDRVRKVLDVLWNRDTWTPEELVMEMPALVTMSEALNGPEEEDALLEACTPK